MILRYLAVYLALTGVCSRLAFAQNAGLAFQLIECEGVGCNTAAAGAVTWSFTGSSGKGRFRSGEQQMTLEHLDRGFIAARRTDITGPVKGLTALYLGEIEGQRIAGSVLYYAPGQTQPNSGTWTGILSPRDAEAIRGLTAGQTAPSLPLSIVECEGNCKPDAPDIPIWLFDSRTGKGLFRSGEQTLSLDRFDRDLIVVRRTDKTGPSAGLTAVYLGKIDGTRITGVVTYRSGGNSPNIRTSPWFGILDDRKSPSTAALKDFVEKGVSQSTSHVAEKSNSTSQTRTRSVVPQMSEPTPAMATVKLDMNGVWNAYYISRALVKTIRITQNGDDITAEDLKGDESPTGRVFFRGKYPGPGSRINIEEAEYEGIFGMMGQPRAWHPEVITIGDPDHFRVGNHSPFVRVHSPALGDVPCDFDNRFNTWAWGAFLRGSMQANAKNYKEAFCWDFVGAQLGERNATANLAFLYASGFGVEKDYAMALKLFTVAAEAGSINAAHSIAVMYNLGQGVPKDPAQVQVWLAKEAQLRADLKKRQDADRAADEKYALNMEAILLLGRVAAGVISDAGMQSPLCDWNSSTNSERDVQRKKDALRSDGLRCEDGKLRSDKK